MEVYRKTTYDGVPYQVRVQQADTHTNHVDTDETDPNYADSINNTGQDGTDEMEFVLFVEHNRTATAAELDARGISFVHFSGGKVEALEVFAENYIEYEYYDQAIKATKRDD